jgi:DNA-binding winged helix-turn-helix (wHTH) protein
MDTAAGLGVYEFGDFRLDANRRTLRSLAYDVPIRVAAKVFDTALFLVEHPGEVLPKARLLAHLWPGLVVEENNLTQAISDLRRALGETRGENRYVATVPRRGYQFVAEVRRLEHRSVQPRVTVHTVAVHPFQNLSGRRRDDFVATGLTESIQHRVVGLGTVRLLAHVPSRYVIEGSVQHSGGRLRITAQLVDMADGSHVWSLLFDQRADDLFAVEDAVSAGVAQALSESLVPLLGAEAVGDARGRLPVTRQFEPSA